MHPCTENDQLQLISYIYILQNALMSLGGSSIQLVLCRQRNLHTAKCIQTFRLLCVCALGVYFIKKNCEDSFLMPSSHQQGCQSRRLYSALRRTNMGKRGNQRIPPIWSRKQQTGSLQPVQVLRFWIDVSDPAVYLHTVYFRPSFCFWTTGP